MGEYSYILEQQGKTTSEKLAEFTAAIGWRDELATYRIAQDEYETRAAAAAEQGISLLDEPPYTAEELAALDAESAAYYDAFAANYVATAAFSGSGSGTAEDPYIITNRAQLEAMADDLTAYYQLGNHINLGGSSSPWTPIGTNSAPFSGKLDGNGYTISGMYASSSAACGLFGYAWPVTIKNIAIVDATIAGGTYCGILAGLIGINSAVSNVYVSGSVSATVNAGGIVGYFGSSPGTSSTVSVSISDAYANVIVDAPKAAAVIGLLATSSSTSASTTVSIDRVYATGTVTGSTAASGIALVNRPYPNPVLAIRDSVSLVSTISGTNAARIVCPMDTVDTGLPQILSGNYANAAMLVNGNTVSGGTTSNRNGADVSASTYNTQAFWETTLGWNFDTVWYWDDTANLPKLRVFLRVPIITSVSATPTTGGTTTQITLSATDENSYQWQYSTNSGSSWQNIPGANTIIATWTPGAVGTYQVRLLATNSNSTTISDTVTVTIYPDPIVSEVTIYPNPSDESATFLISTVVNDS